MKYLFRFDEVFTIDNGEPIVLEIEDPYGELIFKALWYGNAETEKEFFNTYDILFNENKLNNNDIINVNVESYSGLLSQKKIELIEKHGFPFSVKFFYILTNHLDDNIINEFSLIELGLDWNIINDMINMEDLFTPKNDQLDFDYKLHGLGEYLYEELFSFDLLLKALHKNMQEEDRDWYYSVFKKLVSNEGVYKLPYALYYLELTRRFDKWEESLGNLLDALDDYEVSGYFEENMTFLEDIKKLLDNPLFMHDGYFDMDELYLIEVL